jgi:O-antigen ligase
MAAALIAACWIWWAGNEGGYFPRDWSPAGIGLVLLTFAVAVGGRRALPARPVLKLALALLGAFVGWAFLSMLWAEAPGSTWEAAAKLLPILAVCWTVALLPWSREPATAFVGAWAVGVAVVCFFALLEARDAPDLGGLATVGRLAVPTGYTNAAGSLAWTALFGALMLSYRRDLPAPVQGIGLGAAMMLLGFGLLSQSRGALLAFGAGVLVFLALASDRLRLLLRVGVLALLLAAGSDAILDVQVAADARSGVGPALDEALRVLLLTSSLALLAGLALGLIELWLAKKERAVRAARTAALGLVGLTCAAVVVLAVANAGPFVSDLDERWSRLTDESSSPDGRRSRFGTLDPEGRTDAWRVAVDLFEERPMVGIGLGNYDREHTARREVERHSRYVHNLWLRVLAETGVVGMLLLLGSLVCLIGAALVRLRRLDPGTRAVSAACLAVSTVFLAHASLDWVEEFPALALPGFGLLFLAATLNRPVPPAPRPRRLGRLAVVAGALVTVVGVLAIALPYVSTLWTDRALERFRQEPAEAYRDLDRARAANPLSVRGWVTEGTIALALDDRPRAQRAFQRSLEVEDNWYAHLELALVYASRRRFDAALDQIEASRRLNAADPSVARARRLIERRRPIDPPAFNRRLLDEARSYFTRPES